MATTTKKKPIDPWSKLTKPQQTALWQIQLDGGLIMTMHSPDKSPYSTKAARIIDLRVAKALIVSGELMPDGGGFDFGPPQAWAVAHPKEGL